MSKMYKEIDLSHLPTKGKLIDWKSSIGYECNFIYDDVYGTVKIINYDKTKTKLTVLYKNTTYELNTGPFTKCSFGKLLNKFTSEFRFKVGTVIKDDKIDIELIGKKNKRSKNGNAYKFYKYKCNKCSNIDWISEDNMNIRGCNVCCNPSRKVLKGYNDIFTTHPFIVENLVDKNDAFKYSQGSHKKVKIKCIYCGNEKYTEVYNLCALNFSCNKCSDGISYPNKFMFYLLEQLNVDFITEYSPEWIGRKSYDFYVPSKNLIIEMDGRLGHGNKKVIGTLSSNESKKIDDYKDKMANKNNIEVIRINCCYLNLADRFDFIKSNTLNSKLSHIFNLNNIDWKYINENSCENLLKNICDFKNKNPNILSGELSEKFKLSPYTIVSYLKVGHDLGWCVYDNKQYYKSISKKVEVFKNGESLGVYRSISYVGDNSKNIFGVKLNKSNISKVCKGIWKQHKGFTFKYA